jgi:hypothetical protein
MFCAVIALTFAVGCSDDAPTTTTTDAQPSPVASPGASENPVASASAPADVSPNAAFDVEAWRQRTIKRFGPEKTYKDGSKFSYVEAAYAICGQEDRPDYEKDSLQKYIVETFCPNAYAG